VRSDCPYLVGSKTIEHDVVGRMHCHQLTLEVTREFGDRHPLLFELTLPVLTVLGGGSGLFEIDAPRIPGRDLDTDVSQVPAPISDGVEVVEGSLISHVLRQK